MMYGFRKDLEKLRVKVDECYEKIKELCSDTETLDRIAADNKHKLILHNDDEDRCNYSDFGDYVYELTNGKYRVYSKNCVLWEFAYCLKMHFGIIIPWEFSIPESLFKKYQHLVSDHRKEFLDDIISNFKLDLLKKYPKMFVRDIVNDLECVVFYEYWGKHE